MSTHARHREPGGIIRRIVRVFATAFGTALSAVSGQASTVAPERPTLPPKEYRP